MALASSNLCCKGDKSHKSDLVTMCMHFTNCSTYASMFSWCRIFKCCWFCFILNLVVQCRLPGNYRAHTLFLHLTRAMSTFTSFSPVGLRSSNGMRMCVCVWVWTELTLSMHYVGTSTWQFIPYYASVYTRFLIPVEDSEPTGLKVDIAKNKKQINK